MNLFHESKKVLDKDGKVNPLGPYGKQKLTGQEVANYFRKNKVSDKKVKKAVEVALDLGGAFSVAQQEIKKFFGNSILKKKEVQNALRYANEEFQMTENFRDVIKMFPRDNDWKKLITKHKRHLDDFRKGKKDLDTKVEDELITWALDNGEIQYKDEVEDFIDQVLNASYTPKGDTINEMNGMSGKKIRLTYRPQRANSGKYDGKKLSSHSTIEKSDLYQDIKSNEFDIADDCNSIAIRVPSARGSEKDKEKWLELVKSADRPTGLIRGGGLAPSEVKELYNDMKNAVKAFGGKVLAQSHEVSVNNYNGKLNIDKGLNAMLKAIDEFGMRNHVSVSSKDGVLTRIQDAGRYMKESVEESNLNESIQSIMKIYPRENINTISALRDIGGGRGSDGGRKADAIAQRFVDYMIHVSQTDKQLYAKYKKMNFKDLFKKNLNTFKKTKGGDVFKIKSGSLKESIEESKKMTSAQKREFDKLYKKMDGGKEHQAIKQKIKNPVKADDAFHSLVMKKVLGEAANPAQQAAIAIAKKEKKKNVMDSYKEMWENGQKYAPEPIEEACWDGYVQKGFKMKNGKQVPNCVPVSEDIQEGKVSDAIIRKDFSNVWAASAKDKKILKNFHQVVNTNNYRQMKKAYQKDMKSFVDSMSEEFMNEASMGDMIKKVFNTKSETEAMGIAKLLNMTDVKVALGMQKQNPKGFTKTTFAMGADNSNKDMIKDKDLMKMFKKAGVKPLPEEKGDNLMNSYRSMLEAKSFNQKDIDIVAKLTDRNEHTLSLMHIANLVGDRDAGKKLEMISKLHMEYGHLPQGLEMLRNEIYDSLKKQMKKYDNGDEMYGAT